MGEYEEKVYFMERARQTHFSMLTLQWNGEKDPKEGPCTHPATLGYVAMNVLRELKTQVES